MRFFTACLYSFLLLGVVWPTPGQEASPPTYNTMNAELESWSPAFVIDKIAGHLAGYQKDLVARKEMHPDAAQKEASYLRYFDVSDAPRRYLPAVTAGLFYWNNSMSPAASVARPQPVPGADNRLFFIDLRWYCWTTEAWEKVSLEDPYFREPLVPSGLPSLTYMKSVIGNGVVRASWLLFYAADTSQFLKVGETKADNAFYYTLTYASSIFEREVEEETQLGYYVEIATNRRVTDDKEWARAAKDPRYRFDVTRTEKRKVQKTTVGVVPQNTAEFQRFWGIDTAIKDAVRFTVHRGAVVDEGRSGVSYQGRIIAYYQATRGKYWRTFDVFRTAGDQDFFERTPVPEQDLKDFDGGEHIFQDMKGGLHFLLTAGSKNKEPRVEFADPRLVRDQQSGGKVMLVTGKSCVACHDKGIIPPENEVTKFADLGGKLKGATPFEQDRLKAFYFSNLQRLVKQGQEAYADFIKDCNGLTPEENSTQFQQARTWYAQAVTLEQAAREVGAVDVRELQDACQNTAKGRIGAMILNGKPIPRQTWELGGYAETFLLLIEYRKAAKIPLR